jgi:hypothetical protein
LLVKRVMTGAVVGVTISDRFEWSLISSSVFLVDFAVGYVVAGIILLTAGNQSCYVSESKSLSRCI